MLAGGTLGSSSQVFPIPASLMLPSSVPPVPAAAALEVVAAEHPVPPPATRQTAPHPHMVTTSLDGEYAFSVDLGANAVVGFALLRRPTIALRGPVSTCHLHAGAGPRHLVFHPSVPAAFSVNELDSTVSLFSYDASTGELTELEHIAIVPVGWHTAHNMNASCAIAVSRDGKHVYASNRGHDSIACLEFSMEKCKSGKSPGTPTLRLVDSGLTSSGGSLPWTLCSPLPSSANPDP